MTDFDSVIESIDTLTGEKIARVLNSQPSHSLDERKTLHHNINRLIHAGLDEHNVQGLTVALKAAEWEARYFCGEDSYLPVSRDNTTDRIDVRDTINTQMSMFMHVSNDIAATLIHNNLQNNQQQIAPLEPGHNPYKTGEHVFDLMIKALHLKDQTTNPAKKSSFHDDDYMHAFEVEMTELVRLKDQYHTKAVKYDHTRPAVSAIDKEPKIIPMPITQPTPTPGMVG